MAHVWYIAHPEVVIDADVPVPAWPLSAIGRRRMEQFSRDPRLATVRSVWCSTEQKALDGAAIMADVLDLPVIARPELGENDRSATGFVAPPRFWELVDAFFAHPDESVEGWETARAAQTRVIGAVRALTGEAPAGDIAIVAHGGVGSLLRAHLAGAEISRDFDVPAQGHWFRFNREDWTPVEGWTPMPAAA